MSSSNTEKGRLNGWAKWIPVIAVVLGIALTFLINDRKSVGKDIDDLKLQSASNGAKLDDIKNELNEIKIILRNKNGKNPDAP